MRTIDGIGRVSLRFHTRRRKNCQADHGSMTPAPAASAPPVSMSTPIVTPRPCRRITRTGKLSMTPPSTWTSPASLNGGRRRACATEARSQRHSLPTVWMSALAVVRLAVTQ